MFRVGWWEGTEHGRLTQKTVRLPTSHLLESTGSSTWRGKVCPLIRDLESFYLYPLGNLEGFWKEYTIKMFLSKKS